VALLFRERVTGEQIVKYRDFIDRSCRSCFYQWGKREFQGSGVALWERNSYAADGLGCGEWLYASRFARVFLEAKAYYPTKLYRGCRLRLQWL
jgi:hypothetical protein